MSAGTIIQRSAEDIMPGDCVRLNGCWETVFVARLIQAGSEGDVIELRTQGSDCRLAATALVETVEEEA